MHRLNIAPLLFLGILSTGFVWTAGAGDRNGRLDAQAIDRIVQEEIVDEPLGHDEFDRRDGPR